MRGKSGRDRCRPVLSCRRGIGRGRERKGEEGRGFNRKDREGREGERGGIATNPFDIGSGREGTKCAKGRTGKREEGHLALIVALNIGHTPKAYRISARELRLRRYPGLKNTKGRFYPEGVVDPRLTAGRFDGLTAGQVSGGGSNPDGIKEFLYAILTGVG